MDNKFVDYLTKNFQTEEEKNFIKEFILYLDEEGFVINLSNNFNLLGYDRIDGCKKLLKNFTENEDYIIKKENKKDKRGGHNKENILLTIECYRKLCNKSRQKEAKIIHNCFLKLDHLIKEYKKEQHVEKHIENLKKQIDNLQEELEESSNEVEENIISVYMDKNVLYIGIVEETENTMIVKFGVSKNIKKRFEQHKKSFDKFGVKYIFECDRNVAFEDLIKKECKNTESILCGRLINKKYNGKLQTELLKLDKTFNIDTLYNELRKFYNICVRETLEKKELENRKLRNENYDLKIKIKVLEEKVNILTQSNTIVSNNVCNFSLNDDYIKPEEVEEEKDQITEDILNIIICGHCGHKKTKDEYQIRQETGQYYSWCEECRNIEREKKREKTRKIREQDELKIKEKEEARKLLWETLLSQNIQYDCSCCKKVKTPREYGVSRYNKLYKECIDCRNKKHKKDKKNKVIESNEEENEDIEKSTCNKCHKKFETEFDEPNQRNYKHCKSCRENDSKRYQKSKEIMEELKNVETLQCSYCKKEFKKTMNAHKDGFYKNCEECRNKRKKYDKKKYENNREAILQQKKENYIENQETIRETQTGYYYENQDKILDHKRDKYAENKKI